MNAIIIAINSSKIINIGNFAIFVIFVFQFRTDFLVCVYNIRILVLIY